MKRYTMMNDYGEDISQADPIESEDGEWVRFDDVKDMLHELGYNAGKKAIDNIIKLSKCNCEENFNRIHEPVSCQDKEFSQKSKPWWICPAHGYKKI